MSRYHHYLAIDINRNKIGRCNLTAEQLRTQTANLECCGYIVHNAVTPAPISETDEALLGTVSHPLF